MFDTSLVDLVEDIEGFQAAVMAVQYAPMKLRVPPGFQNLLEGLAREVLREQPEDIIHFAAQYFKNQLQIRDETGKDDAKKGDQMEKLQQEEEIDIDLTDPEVQKAATKIQATFRGHKTRGDVKKHKDEEAAAVKIQASFRGHQARERVKEIKLSRSKEVISEDVEATEADILGKDSAEEAVPEEAGQAEESEAQEPVQEIVVEDESKVPEIQENAEVSEPAAEDQVEEKADVTGKEETEEAVGEEVAGETEAEEAGVVSDAQPDGDEGGLAGGEAEQVDIDLNDPELHSAAVKIQASFRGHKVREEVRVSKSSESLHQADNEVALEEKAEVEESLSESADAEASVAEEGENSKPSED